LLQQQYPTSVELIEGITNILNGNLLSNDTNSIRNNGDGPGILRFIDGETAEHEEEEPDDDIDDEDDEGVQGEFQTPAIQQ